nr:DMT family transporter [Bacillota bacterium]
LEPEYPVIITQSDSFAKNYQLIDTTAIEKFTLIFRAIPTATRNNIIGVIIFLCGMLIYFLPLTETGGVITGYIVMTIGLLANAIATMLGRKVNMERQVSPVIVTTISMAIGGFLLLGTGVATETITTISINYVLLTVLLAVLNTAFAFSLWNKTMQVLTSVESSIINNTMLVQIAILSWLFLDEKFTLKAVTGIIVVSIGVFLVQYRKKNVAKTDTESISLEELKP